MSNHDAYELFPSLATQFTTERQCYVRDGVTSTFVVPGDWVPEDEAKQRVEDYRAPILEEPKEDVWGNDIEWFVDGVEGYPAIWKDVRATWAAPTTSFVCHAGWTCYAETRGFGGATQYLNMMASLAELGVLTTALYWAGSSVPGMREDQEALEEAARRLNALGSDPSSVLLSDNDHSAALYKAVQKVDALWPPHAVRAFIDDQTRGYGSHHQKIWVILGPEGLTAYFGGLDIHTNRVVNTDGNDNHPFHDVEARVRGPAAERLLGIFLWRLIASGNWRDSPHKMPAPQDTTDVVPDFGPSNLDLAERYKRTRAIYRLWDAYRRRGDAQRRSTSQNPVRVRIGQTIGNPRLHAAGFKPEIKGMVENGITRARRFIYIEDQYFWHIPMAQLLADRIQKGKIKQLIIVTNLSEDLAEHPPETRLALQHLAYYADGYTDRILVFERVGPTGRYVHSKMFVFDDVLGARRVGQLQQPWVLP